MVSCLFKKEVFNASETISFACKFVSAFQNSFKNVADEYMITTYPDIVIDEKSYGYYVLHSINFKKADRKKLGSIHYSIEKETQFHLPISRELFHNKEWRLKNKMTNGICYKKQYLNNDSTLFMTETLENLFEVKKRFVIPDACNYSRNGN